VQLLRPQAFRNTQFEISPYKITPLLCIFTVIQKKNVYPVHTQAAVDYNTFNFCDFSSSLAVILYGVILLKKPTISMDGVKYKI
jgi:hypothetical protein